MSWKSKVALGFVVSLTLLVLFLVVEHFRGTWALSRWKARMAAKREPITIPEAIVPTPPPRDNGMPELIGAASQAALLGASQPSLFPWTLRPPTAAYAAQGKVIVITQLDAWPANGRRATNVTWTIVHDALKPRKQALHSAADVLKYPKFHAAVDYYKGWSALLPHLGRLRYLEWTLDAAALHQFHGGQIDDGIESLSSAIRIPGTLEDEAFMISQVVRMAMAQDAFETTWQALHVGDLTDAQLAHLEDAWAQQDFLKSMRRAISMEHIITSWEFERFRNSDTGLYEWLNFGIQSPSPAAASVFDELAQSLSRTPEYLHKAVYTPIWKFAWSYQDEVRSAKTVERGLNAWDMAVAAQAALPLQPLRGFVFEGLMGVDPEDKNLFADFRFMISPRIERSFPAMKQAFATQTLRDLAITAIALKRYELREGKQARTLDQLIPDFLKQLPRDFMDGRPLRYKLTADGPLLYSVGYDGKDDGGDTSAASLSGFNILMGRDFVWPQEASPEEVKARFQTSD